MKRKLDQQAIHKALDMKGAAHALTESGFMRYMKGQEIRPQDFKEDVRRELGIRES